MNEDFKIGDKVVVYAGATVIGMEQSSLGTLILKLRYERPDNESNGYATVPVSIVEKLEVANG